jgi:hypothetical protein
MGTNTDLATAALPVRTRRAAVGRFEFGGRMPGVLERNLAIVGPFAQQPGCRVFESVFFHRLTITLRLTVPGLRIVQQTTIKAVIVLAAAVVCAAGDGLHQAQVGITHALEAHLESTTFRAASTTGAAALIGTQAHVGSEDIANRGAGLG